MPSPSASLLSRMKATSMKRNLKRLSGWTIISRLRNRKSRNTKASWSIRRGRRRDCWLPLRPRRRILRRWEKSNENILQSRRVSSRKRKRKKKNQWTTRASWQTWWKNAIYKTRSFKNWSKKELESNSRSRSQSRSLNRSWKPWNRFTRRTALTTQM